MNLYERVIKESIEYRNRFWADPVYVYLGHREYMELLESIIRDGTPEEKDNVDSYTLCGMKWVRVENQETFLRVGP